MTQQMAAYRAIIAELNEAGHEFPSLENEGGSAHPWARSLGGFIPVHWEMCWQEEYFFFK